MKRLTIDTTGIINSYTLTEEGKKDKIILCNNKQFEKLFWHYERFDIFNIDLEQTYRIITRKLNWKECKKDWNIISFWKTKIKFIY